MPFEEKEMRDRTYYIIALAVIVFCALTIGTIFQQYRVKAQQNEPNDAEILAVLQENPSAFLYPEMKEQMEDMREMEMDAARVLSTMAAKKREFEEKRLRKIVREEIEKALDERFPAQ